MNKFFIIIALSVLQGACATPAPQPVPQRALLSFTDLAAEITVVRKTAAATPESSRTIEKELGDSS